MAQQTVMHIRGNTATRTVMNLKHLETFHFFCRFASMTKAAECLNISQPAVSQQLRSFESECGVKLFYREANQYRLTEVGESLFLLTKRIFCRVEQIEDLLQKARKTTAQRLRVGSTKAYARTLMPDLMAQFQQKFPKIHLRLSEGNSAELITRLRNRREDLVVVARTGYDSSLKSIPFAKAEFLLVARPDHPLASCGPVSMKALTTESLIIREEGSGSREAILKKLSQHGITPSVVVESESLSFILAYIQRRMGISFILSHEIEKELASGVLKPIALEEGTITFHSDILMLRDEPPSAAMKYFLKLAKKARDGYTTKD